MPPSASLRRIKKGRQAMESWRNRKTLVLSRTDMMGLLTPAEYNACVEQAYRMHGEKRFYMDPKGHIVLDKYPGEWEAMPSYIEEPEAAVAAVHRCGAGDPFGCEMTHQAEEERQIGRVDPPLVQREDEAPALSDQQII